MWGVRGRSPLGGLNDTLGTARWVPLRWLDRRTGRGPARKRFRRLGPLHRGPVARAVRQPAAARRATRPAVRSKRVSRTGATRSFDRGIGEDLPIPREAVQGAGRRSTATKGHDVVVAHADAGLTPIERLRIGRLVVEASRSVSAAADYFRVSWPTARRWSDRYRAQLAATGRAPSSAAMADRSSRPHRSPSRTPAPLVRKIAHLRWKQRLGTVQIGGRLGMPASTVHAVSGPLPGQPAHPRRPPQRGGGPPLRPDHSRIPGLVDVKKLGNIPDGGGRRTVGRPEGDRNGPPRRARPRTAAAVLRRAADWFAARRLAHRTGPQRQRLLQPQPALARHLRRARHRPEEGSAPPTAEQRQDLW